MPLAAGTADELAELGDAVTMLADPPFDAVVDVPAAAAAEELDAQLLEVAGKAGSQQPLPLVRRNEASELLLRPIEAQRLAEPSIRARSLQFVELLARLERGDAEHAVKLVEAHQQAHDILAGAERN